MLEVIKDYGLFLGKTITIVLAIVFIIRGIVTAVHRAREWSHERITVKKLNHHYDHLRNTLKEAILPPFELKKDFKEQHKQHKAERKKAKTGAPPEKKRVFVLNFKGDLLASAISSLREEITAVLTVAKPGDEVVVRLESSGGLVNAYGLAASQLLRVRQKKIPLTVAVDKVAASGGYLMACVADRIVAAPFAVIGSIGVASEVPNFHRLLKKHDIDFELITAGEYKRTLTLFGENTEKGRKKFIEQVEETHTLFKEFLRENRAQVEVDTVATGEYWYGRHALDLKLIDDLIASDDYLFAASETSDIYEVEYKPKETLREKIASGIVHTANNLLFSWWQASNKSRFF